MTLKHGLWILSVFGCMWIGLRKIELAGDQKKAVRKVQNWR